MSEKRSFRRYLRELLLLDEPPERTARTFGFGVFIAFSPFIGLQTIIGLVILLFVKMNRLAFLAGVFSNTPWTIFPMLALGTGLGVLVLGSDVTVPELNSDTVASGQFFREVAADPLHLLAPYMIGNFILTTIVAFVSYLLLKWFLVRYRSRRGRDTVAPASPD